MRVYSILSVVVFLMGELLLLLPESHINMI